MEAENAFLSINQVSAEAVAHDQQDLASTPVLAVCAQSAADVSGASGMQACGFVTGLYSLLRCILPLTYAQILLRKLDLSLLPLLLSLQK